jgi:hypothetical protein
MTLQLRSLPQLIEREQPITLLETRRGPYAKEFEDDAHLALRAGWFAADAAASATASVAGTSLNPSGWLQPKLEDGEAAYWL